MATRMLDNSESSYRGPVAHIDKKKSNLKTTINSPGAIDSDRLHYMTPSESASEHIPGICQCDACIQQQEALMNWALMAAQQQHSLAIAEATAAAEAAQRRGDGPKPMMVTPYKHNWVIAGAQNQLCTEERYDLVY